jgi:hypothetical protein
MYCPLHRAPVLHGRDAGRCQTCDRLGLTVIECELDKIDRTRDTLEAQGQECDLRQSHAVLVFRRKES